jgi:hypothetical protein
VKISAGGTNVGADAARAKRTAGASIVLSGRRADNLDQVASIIDPTGKPDAAHQAAPARLSYLIGNVTPIASSSKYPRATIFTEPVNITSGAGRPTLFRISTIMRLGRPTWRP